VSSSEDLSRSFYAQLGADGLANRTRPAWDEEIVGALIETLPEHGRVLDVGCGYGRVTLPLARAGYAVHGLDLSPSMIEPARAAADAQGLVVGLTVASMTNLPYAEASFDAVICLWSTFNELLDEAEQIRTIAEMWRVLDFGGLALIEGRPYEEPGPVEIASGARRGPEHRIEWAPVEGILNPHYRHDERSLRRICRSAEVEPVQNSSASGPGGNGSSFDWTNRSGLLVTRWLQAGDRPRIRANPMDGGGREALATLIRTLGGRAVRTAVLGLCLREAVA
jgi:SAM-dependent methyltransferase